jgi:hypothetical protein
VDHALSPHWEGQQKIIVGRGLQAIRRTANQRRIASEVGNTDGADRANAYLAFEATADVGAESVRHERLGCLLVPEGQAIALVNAARREEQL